MILFICYKTRKNVIFWRFPPPFFLPPWYNENYAGRTVRKSNPMHKIKALCCVYNPMIGFRIHSKKYHC